MSLQVKNLTKYAGARRLLNNINFTINKGQRVGILGRNGCGKSTLLKLIAEEEKPDSGEIIVPKEIKTGYLPQGFCDFHKNPLITVKEFLLEPVDKVMKNMAYLERLMETSKNQSEETLENILNDYGKVQEIFEQTGGYNYEENLKITLEKLGLNNHITVGSNLKFLALSGGQKLKLALSRLLVSKPDLLLLDEPTNYLDIPSLIWLENFLKNFKGSLLVISHDRKFLDKISTDIFEIYIFDGSLKCYSGNYSAYNEEKNKEREKNWQKYLEQQEKISQLKNDISNTKNQALKTELNTVQDFLRGRSKKVAQKAKSREKRLERILSEESRIDKPRELETVRINLESNTKKGKSLLSLRKIDFKFPGGITLFKNVSFDLSCGEKIAIMGPNGSGKSTLLKLIAGRGKPSGGEIIVWPDSNSGYLPQDEGEELRLNKTVLEEFRSHTSMEEGEARTFLHRLLFKGEDVFKKIGCLSYGERMKLLIAKLMVSGVNTLLLDEPTGHLDIDSMERLEKALKKYEGGLIIISHDRYFIEKIDIRKLYVLEKGYLNYYRSYEDYEKNLLIQI